MISWRKRFKKSLLAVGILLSMSSSAFAQEGDAKKGEQLFNTNCAACHALDKQLVGPQLGGVVERVQKEKNLGADWLHKWIKNSQELVGSGDPYAKELFTKFNSVPMPPFPSLSDQDISDILAYTTNPPKKEEKPAAAAAPSSDQVAQMEAEKKDNLNSKIIIGVALSVVGLLIWVLLRLRQLLNLQRNNNLSPEKAKRAEALYQKFNLVGKGLVGVLSLLAVYGLWNWLMWVGVYKGYRPEQPIYFSHKIHAGVNKIDCQFCHSGAKYGKVSEIPSMNVCMNCHKAISEYKGDYFESGKDKAFYDGEIQKIYKAVGWDAGSQSYTGKTEPVQWVRIHNMPDFVYFNHSQHVVAGEKAIIESYNAKNPDAKIDVVCKACHGKVDEMNVVEMANDFTMGWCIECHRTTKVDMTNGYNKEYFTELHNKLKKQYPKSGGKITVDAIGGLECGKCHY